MSREIYLRQRIATLREEFHLTEFAEIEAIADPSLSEEDKDIKCREIDDKRKRLRAQIAALQDEENGTR